MNQEKNNETVRVINFDGVRVPQPTVLLPKDDHKFVPWGVDNKYPYFLLDVYQNSPTHASIINNKADYIVGNGLKLKNGTALDMRMNAQDGIAEFTSKIVKDYLIYNCFAVEVVYNAFNQPIQYFHVPIHKLRSNKSKTKFFFNEDWVGKAKSEYKLDRWVKDSPDSESKIFFFDGYFPTYNQVYPVPEYISGIKSMMVEGKIQTYTINMVDNHFSPSTIITFHQGNNISEEQKAATAKSLHQSYTGTTGKKIIVDFQTQDGKPANVETIDQADADTFRNTNQDVQDKIMIAHQVTSPMLFGVKTEGQLGGATELETSYEIWKNKYVTNKRNEICVALNQLFSNYEAIQGEVEFQDRPLFNSQIKPETLEKIMTINELRKERGMVALPGYDKLVDEVITSSGKPVEAAPAQPVQQSMSKQLIELTDEDFEKIKDMGTLRDDYEFHGDNGFVFSKEDMNRVQLNFENEQEVADYIISKKIKDITLPELKTLIRKDLGITVSTDDLKGYLDNITKSGVANITTDDSGNINVKPSGEEKPRRVEVMYAYELREGVSGAPIIETTRPFCRRLIQNNRVYTRAEIQRMSAIFGYDVFNMGGGFFRDPQTGEATPFCRHRFKSYTVSRRNRG